MFLLLVAIFTTVVLTTLGWPHMSSSMRSRQERLFLEAESVFEGDATLFEGDMMLNPKQYASLVERKSAELFVDRWPKGPAGFPVVPFVFGDKQVNQKVIKAAFKHWESRTCIRFQKATNTSAPYLRFVYLPGCWSYVGRQNSPGQNISIGRRCDYLPIVIHEIGHAIGFLHEQSRLDRGNYVTILTENIREKDKKNFQSYSDANYGIEYDYSSIMHYPPLAFSKNGKFTAMAKNPMEQETIGQSRQLTQRDVKLACIMYSCSGKWAFGCQQHGACASDDCGCDNEGCSCACPSDYYAPIRSGHSKRIVEEQMISSPDSPAVLRMVKVIESPECKLPQLEFSYFSIYGRITVSNVSMCYHEYLAIQVNGSSNPEMYCGREISPGTVIGSTTRDMVLYFKRVTENYNRFSAELTFVPDPTCSTPTHVTPGNAPDTTKPSTVSTVLTVSTDLTSVGKEKEPTTISAETTVISTELNIVSTETIPSSTNATVVSNELTNVSKTNTTVSKITTTVGTDLETRSKEPTTVNKEQPSISTEVTTVSPILSLTATCHVDHSIAKGFHWLSPGYLEGNNYPNNFKCYLKAFVNNLTVLYTFNTFATKPSDKVSITIALGVTRRFSRKWSGHKQFTPACVINNSFISSEKGRGMGFNITVELLDSDHHKLIDLTSGRRSNGTIDSPGYPQMRKGLAEYWIKAPEGKEIELTMHNLKLQRKCKLNYVAVNSRGNRNYPTDTSVRFCHKVPQITTSLRSSGGWLNVLYQASSEGSFLASYSVV